jgi:hypothetical protein
MGRRYVDGGSLGNIRRLSFLFHCVHEQDGRRGFATRVNWYPPTKGLPPVREHPKGSAASDWRLLRSRRYGRFNVVMVRGVRRHSHVTRPITQPRDFDEGIKGGREAPPLDDKKVDLSPYGIPLGLATLED